MGLRQRGGPGSVGLATVGVTDGASSPHFCSQAILTASVTPRSSVGTSCTSTDDRPHSRHRNRATIWLIVSVRP